MELSYSIHQKETVLLKILKRSGLATPSAIDMPWYKQEDYLREVHGGDFNALFISTFSDLYLKTRS